MAFDLCEP